MTGCLLPWAAWLEIANVIKQLIQLEGRKVKWHVMKCGNGMGTNGRCNH